MKSTYFTIQLGKKSSSKWLPVEIRFYLEAPVSHPPLPNSTGLFPKPTGSHYTKYQFSPDIAT
jgi:hypothetical protein